MCFILKQTYGACRLVIIITKQHAKVNLDWSCEAPNEHSCSHVSGRLRELLRYLQVPLQLGPGPLAVLEPALGVPEPQQLLLQQAVLSLQENQLPEARPCIGLPLPQGAPRGSFVLRLQ